MPNGSGAASAPTVSAPGTIAGSVVSALVGLGQVFRPATFNPPVIPGVTDVPEDSIQALALYIADSIKQRLATLFD